MKVIHHSIGSVLPRRTATRRNPRSDRRPTRASKKIRDKGPKYPRKFSRRAWSWNPARHRPPGNPGAPVEPVCDAEAAPNSPGQHDSFKRIQQDSQDGKNSGDGREDVHQAIKFAKMLADLARAYQSASEPDGFSGGCRTPGSIENLGHDDIRFERRSGIRFGSLQNNRSKQRYRIVLTELATGLAGICFSSSPLSRTRTSSCRTVNT